MRGLKAAVIDTTSLVEGLAAHCYPPPFTLFQNYPHASLHMGKEESRKPEILVGRERFPALLEMAKAAEHYGASLHVYGDCFVIEDGEGATAVAAL